MWKRSCQERNFPGKSTGAGCHFLFQGICPTQRLNQSLLHWQVGSWPLSHLGSPRGKDSYCQISQGSYLVEDLSLYQQTLKGRPRTRHWVPRESVLTQHKGLMQTAAPRESSFLISRDGSTSWTTLGGGCALVDFNSTKHQHPSPDKYSWPLNRGLHFVSPPTLRFFQ